MIVPAAHCQHTRLRLAAAIVAAAIADERAAAEPGRLRRSPFRICAAGRSKAKVYVDGRYIKTIDTTGDTMRCRQLVEIKSFASAGSHTVRVVNSGTAGRTLLNVDGLVAAR